MSLPAGLTHPPPSIPNTVLSFPTPRILLVTLNRPRALNSIPSTSHPLFDELWRWYDTEPSLRCAILTGTGRAFCCGADLKEWNNRAGGGGQPPPPPSGKMGIQSGFGGLSNRGGKKPIIAAVNGLCLGGGMEMALNCDVVLASAQAQFGLPEVKRGVIALAGALPRLQRTVGKQRAAEMALMGRQYGAADMARWGVVNKVLADGEDVVAEALKWAGEISENSPDSVIVTREALKLAWEPLGPEMATEVLERGMYGRMDKAENMVEGLVAFVEKRLPAWRDSKL